MAETILLARGLVDLLVEALARSGVAADDRAVLCRARQDPTLRNTSAALYTDQPLGLFTIDGLLDRIRARRAELRAEARVGLARDVALTRPIL